jgi:hypothetical protein
MSAAIKRLPGLHIQVAIRRSGFHVIIVVAPGGNELQRSAAAV